MRPLPSGDDAPIVHAWTGPEDLPELVLQEEPVPALMVAGAAMPKAEVRRRAGSFAVRRLETPGWKVVDTPNAHVRGDADLEALRTAGALAEELNVALRSALGGGDARYAFRVFRNEADFRRFAALAGAANAESFYDPRSGEAVFWFGQFATPQLLQRAFAHEFTHAFMDRALGRTGPLWFAEGMAEYFSNLDWRAWMLVPGQLNPHALLILSTRDWRPLESLLRIGRSDIYGQDFPKLYAQSWSLVHYLFSRDPARVRRVLEEGNAAIDPAETEPAWREHVEALVAEAS